MSRLSAHVHAIDRTTARTLCVNVWGLQAPIIIYKMLRMTLCLCAHARSRSHNSAETPRPTISEIGPIPDPYHPRSIPRCFVHLRPTAGGPEHAMHMTGMRSYHLNPQRVSCPCRACAVARVTHRGGLTANAISRLLGCM